MVSRELFGNNGAVEYLSLEYFSKFGQTFVTLGKSLYENFKSQKWILMILFQESSFFQKYFFPKNYILEQSKKNTDI